MQTAATDLPPAQPSVANDRTNAGAQAAPVAVAVCNRAAGEFALASSTAPVEPVPLAVAALADAYDLLEDSAAWRAALKRALDVAAAAAALVVLLPLLLVLAALIKLSDGGPVFFAQRRVGLSGDVFRMLKFRSMVVDAERLRPRLEGSNERNGPVFKMKLDPRVTPIGRFLRKYSIDELPQLINVLRGEMSLVGPRPPLPSEVSRYEPWQRRRLSVRPGLTCLWQVSGRNQISFEEWMYLDMRYIDHWSLSEDLSLIMKTFPVVLTGRGAS